MKSLNRDADKYVISFFTDTETLAIYTNASKMLPFDVIMSSFITILVPYLMQKFKSQMYKDCLNLYKSFLEIAYITTTILAIGAICVAPELMKFLYGEKYLSTNFGIYVFITYILVDVFNFLNIVTILNAAGKAKTIMLITIGSFGLNLILNIILFLLLGEIGPALATLIVTLFQGTTIQIISAKALKTNFIKLFNIKYLIIFIVQTSIMFVIIYAFKKFILSFNLNYLIVLFLTYFLFIISLCLINIKRIKQDLMIINEYKIE